MKEKILHLLAQGIKAAQVASVVGCSSGYVSQLAMSEEGKKRLEELRAEYGQKEDADGVVLSNKYNAIEHSLLKQIGDSLENAELPALTRTLEVIGNRQEKRLARMVQAQAVGQGLRNLHVHLTLPAHATVNLPSFQMNENKEVIAIGGREMAPMSSDGVKNLFSQIAATRLSAASLAPQEQRSVTDSKVVEAVGFREVHEALPAHEVDISGEEF